MRRPYDIHNRPMDIPLIVNCDHSDVTKHGVTSTLMEDRVREAKRALEALRLELLQASSESGWTKSPHLLRWFNEYSRHGTVQLYARCSRILNALGNSVFEIKCAEKLGGLVGRGGMFRVVIYAAAFGPKSLEEQLATVIHEVGHPVVAGADFKYYPKKCVDLAEKHPAVARVNLDNLAYCALECLGYKFPT